MAMVIAGDRPDRVLLGMIVPDGASVVATYAGGRTESLVSAGGAVSTVLHRAEAVTLTTAGGVATRYDIPAAPRSPVLNER